VSKSISSDELADVPAGHVSLDQCSTPPPKKKILTGSYTDYTLFHPIMGYCGKCGSFNSKQHRSRVTL